LEAAAAVAELAGRLVAAEDLARQIGCHLGRIELIEHLHAVCHGVGLGAEHYGAFEQRSRRRQGDIAAACAPPAGRPAGD